MAKKEINIHVPEWARGIVWYQIFPERFRNGDPNNTPGADAQKNAWPHDAVSRLEMHPWEADWYQLQPYEKENGKDIWLNIQRRRYGGDLQGILDQLDYLEDLGIGGLYLNPVFHAPSHHKYDAVSYHHVDPYFGPDPQADLEIIEAEDPADAKSWKWTHADELLLQLIEEVHQRGMYLILDGVFNHMGLNSWIYQDILKHQKASRYADWLDVISWADTSDNDPESPFRHDFHVKKWEGFNELPELRQDRRGLVDGPKGYIFEITRRWMDPYGNGDTSSGVDGWRLDVAFCIKHPFWKSWRKHVRSINPEAYLVAEVIDSIKKTAPYLKGDEFDAVMNYNFKFACNDFFVWDENRLTASQFANRLEELQRSFPEPIMEAMQNVLGSHDTDRISSRIRNSHIGGGRRWWAYYNRSKADNTSYDARKPDEKHDAIKKLMVLVQFTYPGSPMIYYGDEAGMWGANDPCCRKPMIWPDYEHKDEQYNQDGKRREPADPVSFDRSMHAYYKRLAHLKHQNPCLKKGSFEVTHTDDATSVLVYRRFHENQSVWVVLNAGKKKQKLSIQTKAKSVKNLMTEEEYVAKSDKVNVEVEPGEGVLIGQTE